MASNAGDTGRPGTQRTWGHDVEMAAFDQLPSGLRAELRDAHLEWPAMLVHRFYFIERRSAAEIARKIRTMEGRA